MDRSWISTKIPSDPEYQVGVREFIKFAVKNGGGRSKLRCPCIMCHNFLHKRPGEILNHLSKWAFDKTYTCWIWHGECRDETTVGNSEANVCEGHNTNEGDRLEEMLHQVEEAFDEDPFTFESLLNDSEKPLYEGCTKYTRLSAIIRLYNVKASQGLTDIDFNLILEVFKDMLPDDNVLPSRTYEAKKTLSLMGLPYEKIHACPNDCMLYRNQNESLESCSVCNASRYKKEEGRVPAKVLWYFPIIPRFKRLFSNARDAEKLTWHFDSREDDGFLRHPADSPQWRFIDGKFPEFAKEKRNLRLALSTDGFNPFGSLSSTYSTWPVVLITYNLSPTLCMKRRYMMLSLLISGPRQPGNDIDVYLAPLIDDLKMLLETGVEVFDAYRNEKFNLKAMLFCTIQDFPAYGNLSGYTVKGKAACPLCMEQFPGHWLNGSGKHVFDSHRVFLPCDHHYRYMKKTFNGKQEFGERPKIMSGVEVFEKIKDIQITFGKKHRNFLSKQGFKKCSKLWSLPYWRFLFVRHSLDVMHIEKNVCDSLIGTLLNIPGKTKDGPKSRADLETLGIRQELHVVEKESGRKYLPPAAYTLSRKEKIELCESLAGVKVPQGYSSNIRSLVNMDTLKLVGLKSHDCHVLMQQLLPVAIRSILPKNVRHAIIRLCLFFNAIYSKVIDPKDLKALEEDIIIILCQLEMYFPPSFFDIMVHLTVHLVREIRYCGPVYLRVQWAFERQMRTYQGYVTNAYRPEGCIAEKLFYGEVVAYVSEFMVNAMKIGLPVSRHSGRMDGHGTLGRKQLDMSYENWHKAHSYILHNEDEVAPYVERHMRHLRKYNPRANPKSLAEKQSKSFIVWFKDEVIRELEDPSVVVSDRVKSLAFGPNFSATYYSGYVINGCTFYTRFQDDISTMQNSGVTLESEAIHFASAKDKNPVCATMRYYGVIEEIWELHYSKFSIPVFKCQWFDSNGVVESSLGQIFVNLKKTGHKEDPFILANQARQIFYMNDPSDKRMAAVITPRSRVAFFSIDATGDCLDDTMLEASSLGRRNVQVRGDDDDDNADDSSMYVRDDHNEGTWVEEQKNSKGVKLKRKRKRSN
ncbi:uncharacterized protein [Spinacia oleracea]|uniref:Transposase-associated domain-containing protein n=1 Tax=Spinacia oleracea TaxID=3562 RepID=A0ABM3RPK5_SPIOL|nr:uncharacterized protein LOC130471424 [Spinacia oleracea]